MRFITSIIALLVMALPVLASADPAPSATTEQKQPVLLAASPPGSKGPILLAGPPTASATSSVTTTPAAPTVPSAPVATTSAKSVAPPSSAASIGSTADQAGTTFAEIVNGGVTWSVDKYEGTSDFTSCLAYPKTGPNAYVDPNALSVRLEMARSKQSTGVDDNVSLSVYAPHDASVYDKAMLLDGAPIVSNKHQRERLLQYFKPDMFRERFTKAGFVKFNLGGKTAQFPASLFVQLLDKLDACAVFKKAK